jgi:catechol 2,3-dioxygenase-like lactoylglutathione lyase family enzyme
MPCEVGIRVRELERAEKLYRELLGLEIGLREEQRRMLFLRAGGGSGMVVLREDRGEWPSQHFAFTIDASEIDGAADPLREAGLSVHGPVVHDWMPAKSVYFSDPDGHRLEPCAPL